MLPRNPFYTTYAETVDSSSAFISLFDHQAIASNYNDGTRFISEDMFEKTVLFTSTPGGGKSSIFQLFSPEVLTEIIRQKNENRSCYDYLSGLNVINGNTVQLLGVLVPCARNYQIIEDIYSNGHRLQVFYALLNVRIVKEAFRSLLKLINSDIDSLSMISFCEIPNELSSYISAKWTGTDIYKWAVEEELLLCDALNNMDDNIAIKHIHNNISMLRLFEPNNITFRGKKIIDRVLFMFDDIHKLTRNQRTEMINNIFSLRARVGVWLAQRCIALSENEVLGQDGIIGREYYQRKIEQLYEENSNFNKALEAIADRRAKINQIVEVSSYKACLAEVNDIVSDHEAQKRIAIAYEKMLEYVNANCKSPIILNSVDRFSSNLYERAIALRVVKIFRDRRINNTQLVFEAFVEPTASELEEYLQDKQILSSAEFYLCHEYSIPYYYGFNKVCSLSFNNVFQFLFFAGAIFERRLALKYIAKKRTPLSVSPSDQDAIIRRLSNERWNELNIMYTDAKKIRSFLTNIATIGSISRDKGQASYAGGAYTGIGIKEQLMNKILTNDRFRVVRELLATSISGNLLKMKTVNQGSKGEKVRVFYLNRWICVYFDLPLAFGGWKPCNTNLIEHLVNDSTEHFQQTMNYYIGGDSYDA